MSSCLIRGGVSLVVLFVASACGGGDAPSRDADWAESEEADAPEANRDVFVDVDDAAALRTIPAAESALAEFSVDGGACTDDGWCWLWPVPAGGTLYAAAAAEGQVVLAGGGGSLLRSVDGSPWMVISGRLGDQARFFSVVRGPDGVWRAAGCERTRSAELRPIVVRIDGNHWARETVPDAPDVCLYALASSDATLVAVGSVGTLATPRGGVVWELGAEGWEERATPVDLAMATSVAMSPDGRLWVTDGSPSLRVREPTGEWSLEAIPSASHGVRVWFVDGLLYTVDLDGSVFVGATPAESVPVGNLGRGFEPALDVGFFGDRPYPIGPAGTAAGSGGILLASSGEDGMLTVALASPTGLTEWLSEELGERVWAVVPDGDGCLAVGDRGMMLQATRGALRRISREPPWRDDELWLAGDRERAVVVVAADSSLDGVLEWRGDRWSPVLGPPEGTPLGRTRAVWMAGDCLYVSTEGLLLRWRGGTNWEAWDSVRVGGDVRALSGATCDGVVALDTAGFVRVLAGTEWPALGTAPASVLGVWAGPSGRVYAFGGGVQVWNGTGWDLVGGDSRWVWFAWGLDDGAGGETVMAGLLGGGAPRVFRGGAWESVECAGSDCWLFGMRGWSNDDALGFSTFGWLTGRGGVWSDLDGPWGVPSANIEGKGGWVLADGTALLLVTSLDRPPLTDPGLLVHRTPASGN